VSVMQVQPKVLNPERDLEMLRAFSRGERQHTIAARFNVTQQAVSLAVKRARALNPPEPRDDLFDQSVEILSDGLAVFTPMMLEGDKAAGRLVDRLLGRRNEMLGLDSPAKLELYQAQYKEQVQTVDVKTELAALLDKIRSEQHA
jgi:hypothetical protein